MTYEVLLNQKKDETENMPTKVHKRQLDRFGNSSQIKNLPNRNRKSNSDPGSLYRIHTGVLFFGNSHVMCFVYNVFCTTVHINVVMVQLNALNGITKLTVEC